MQNTADNYTTLFAEVVVPLSVPNTYTYRIPRDMNEEAIPGVRVVVPFGKKKLYVGIIFSVHENPPKEYEAKYLLHILDNVPLLSTHHLHFWQWVADYYLCYPGEVLQAALPTGLKLQSETKIGLQPGITIDELLLDPHELEITALLQQKGEATPDNISTELGLSNCYKYIKSLHERGIICFIEELEEVYKPVTDKYISILPAMQHDDALNDVFNLLEKKAPVQMQALMRFIEKAGINGKLLKSDLTGLNGVSAQAVQALIKKEVFEETEKQTTRIHLGEGQNETQFELTPPQLNAFLQINLLFENTAQVLLYGVTSSGKTHVYLKLIEKYLKQKKQVLYLVPEIALTAQLVERVKDQFGDSVAVWHSKFNTHEKVELWYAVVSGKAKIILGARSAVFLPFKSLGLVIIDEEHENSYKQFDPNPRYNGRDAAIMLAHLSGAVCLLGSATPSVETYYNVVTGKYGYAELNERFGNILMPEIELIDMKTARHQKTVSGIFSDTLLNAIKERLNKKEQVILFLNRKGYVPVTECADCNWAPKCINCDISLTYYKSINKLRCHYCGYHHEPVSQCPACGGTHIEISGYGTERVEDELKLLLPGVSIGRFDYDTTRNRNAHQKILKDFENGNTEVLIGTQMIAKGLDFDKVKLVGILHADHMFNFPDFRASERAFQLIMQVAGRAGRRDERGKVYIQTYRTGHPVLHEVLSGNFKTFFTAELPEREKFRYPPFYRLVKVTLRNRDYHLLNKAADFLYFLLEGSLGNMVLKPQSPHVSRIRNYYLKDILIRFENQSKDIAKVKHHIKKQILHVTGVKEYRSVYIHADVDPY